MLVGAVAKIRNGTLLKYRQDHGLTQKQAALQCGVTLNAWNAIECMRFGGVLYWADIKTVAEVFNVFPDDICPPELRKKNLRLEATVFRETQASLLLAHDVRTRSELPSPEQILIDKERLELARAAIAKALDTLSPREREVIEVRYGVAPQNGDSPADAARKIGLSRERVRQIEVVALDKLRLPCHHLEEFVED